MKFCSTYLWEKGSGQVYHPVSLILQQVEVCKQSVLFACVCRGTVWNREEGKGNTKRDNCKDADNKEAFEVEVSGYFTEALVEWFHRDCLRHLERKGSGNELERKLQEELTTIQKEAEKCMKKRNCRGDLEFVGILLVERWFVLFGKGKAEVYLLNRRYNRKHIRQLAGGEKAFYLKSGVLQKRLGLLLCSGEFLAGLEKAEVAEVLLADGELAEERFEKRLKELWREENSVGAVYFRTY